jgi:transcriptional regulator with XRE-family HTH domain
MTERHISGGELLAQFRLQYGGLSQQELANRVEASRSMIAQLEGGTRQPSSDLLTSLCQAFPLRAVERAMLFLSFGKVQADQESMLPYVIAVLRLDPCLSADQVRALSVLAVQAYHHETAVQADSDQLYLEIQLIEGT